ncbi:MAG: alpha/beta hydrolase [Pseudomonadota bacterium]
MTVELNHRIDGSGPRVLLLHAVGMDLTLLDALAAILAKEFTILRVDLRGHGQSPYAPAAGLEDYADDVHAALVKLAFAPCAVAGFALGGMVTQALAVKYPEDVTALVISNINHQQNEQSRAGLMSRATAAREVGMAGIVDSSMPRWFTDSFIARGGDLPVRTSLASSNLNAWCDGYTAMANIDSAPKLKSITVPVLCLTGEVDRSMPPPAVKAMADTIPGARYLMIPGAPHMAFFEMPEETAGAIGGFFREVLV